MQVGELLHFYRLLQVVLSSIDKNIALLKGLVNHASSADI